MPAGKTMKEYAKWFESGQEPRCSGKGISNVGQKVIHTVDDGNEIKTTEVEKLPHKERHIRVKKPE